MQSKKTEHSYIEILQRSLEKKLVVLDKIMEENRNMAVVAQAEKFNPDLFDEIFDRKDALIKELNELDVGFRTVYAHVREELTGNKEEHKEEIANLQSLIKQVTDKSVAIQVEEKRNQVALNNRMDAFKKEVYQTKNTRKIMANYFNNMTGRNVIEPQFMDKKK